MTTYRIDTIEKAKALATLTGNAFFEYPSRRVSKHVFPDNCTGQSYFVYSETDALIGDTRTYHVGCIWWETGAISRVSEFKGGKAIQPAVRAAKRYAGTDNDENLI